MALLINGNGFSPVTAQEDADLYGGLVGQTLIALPVGMQMTATQPNSNTVRILDGEAICQGRRIHIRANTYDDFTIPAGTQGVTRYFAIGYKYTQDQDTGAEVITQFVIEIGDASAIPAQAIIRDGYTESYFTFYVVERVGVNIGSIIANFGVMDTIPDIANDFNTLSENLTTLDGTVTGLSSTVGTLNSAFGYVGAVAGTYNGADTIANKNVSTATDTILGSFSIPAGLWVIQVVVRFASNATGRRFAALVASNSASAASISIWTQDARAAVNGAETFLRIVTFANYASTTTTYVKAWQNSGSTLSVATRWGAMRFK